MFRAVPKEIKEEVLGKVKAGQKVVALASQYGISTKTIYGWLSRLVSPPISLLKYQQLKRENEELKRIVGMMALDLEEKKEKYLAEVNNRKLIAPLLGISRNRLYYRRKKETQDLDDKQVVTNLHLVHPSYGHKRVALALSWSHNKAKRIMAKFGFKPPRRKEKKVWLTRSVDSHHYTNLIKNVMATKPNQIFVSDLTYLRFQGKNVYLATIEDIFTREIVAAELSDQHDSNLALRTIKQAIGADRHPETFHTDQGGKFMAQMVTNYLENNQVKISVSDKGSPWQNGYKESFFGKFKDENGDLNRFETLGEFVEEIYAYISYHNSFRIHTALKMPPAQFKRRFLDADTLLKKSGT